MEEKHPEVPVIVNIQQVIAPAPTPLQLAPVGNLQLQPARKVFNFAC